MAKKAYKKSAKKTGKRKMAVQYGGKVFSNYNNTKGRPEKKSIDSWAVGATVNGHANTNLSMDVSSAGGAIKPSLILNLLKAGSEYYNRIGRKLTLSEIYIKGFIKQNRPTYGGQVRMLLVWDKQPNTTEATLADILYSHDTSAATKVVDTTNHINLTRSDRFKIISEKTFQFSNVVTVTSAAPGPEELPGDGGNPRCQKIKIFRSLTQTEHQKWQSIYNDGNQGSIGDIISGSLLLFIFSDPQQTIGAYTYVYNTQYDVYLTARVRYMDN